LCMHKSNSILSYKAQMSYAMAIVIEIFTLIIEFIFQQHVTVLILHRDFY